jgi:hypothetical protein
VNDTNTYSTSANGDISFLWEGNGGTNSYSLPYLQNGQSTWFRMQVLFPDGTNPAYPGVFHVAPGPSGWDYIEEWHSCVQGIQNCACAAGYSTSVQVHGGSTGATGSDPNTLSFVPIGGDASSQTWTWLYQTNGTGSRIPLKYNHWYDILVHLVFGTTSQAGLAEWWVDGVLQSSVQVPTISYCANGAVPGVSHEVGLYRGPSETYTDTVYVDGVVDGPTRASVGG